MQFSTDLRYIRGGSVTMHRDGCVHPMDGKWQVVWVPPLPDLPNGASIDVVAGEWTLLGVPCRLDLSDRSSPHFPWPTGRDGNQVRATQRLASVVNPDGATLGPAAGLSFDNGRGPPVGSSVVWSTDDPAQQPSMTWVRESIGGASPLAPKLRTLSKGCIGARNAGPPPPRVTPFGPRGLYYLRQIDRAPLSPPLYRQVISLPFCFRRRRRLPKLTAKRGLLQRGGGLGQHLRSRPQGWSGVLSFHRRRRGGRR